MNFGAYFVLYNRCNLKKKKCIGIRQTHTCCYFRNTLQTDLSEKCSWWNVGFRQILEKYKNNVVSFIIHITLKLNRREIIKQRHFNSIICKNQTWILPHKWFFSSFFFFIQDKRNCYIPSFAWHFVFCLIIYKALRQSIILCALYSITGIF